MSLVINHNMMASNAARTLNAHYGKLANSTNRLSSGLRINSAADDAAGLAIRELQRADIATLQQGARNANDAVSLIQTADGALQIIDEKLIRMKELAEQAATGTYDSIQRLMIESEYQAMASEITRIAKATDFNGIHLLNGNLATDEHDGSGLVAKGKMKIHFGTGNDSAEDYYYIQIAEATSQAFGVGNASTWKDVSERISKTFSTELKAKLERLYNDPSVDAATKAAIRAVAGKWDTEFAEGLTELTTFSSAGDLDRLYNAFNSDAEVSSISSVFEKSINNFDAISDRERQKMQYALGHAAMRALVNNPDIMTTFGDKINARTVAAGAAGIAADNASVQSAFSSSEDGSLITYFNDASDAYKITYIPPADYNAAQYNKTTGQNAPEDYPMAFSAPQGTYDNSGTKNGHTYTSNMRGDLLSYEASGGVSSYSNKVLSTYKDIDGITAFDANKNPTEYVYLDSAKSGDRTILAESEGTITPSAYYNAQNNAVTKFDSTGNIKTYTDAANNVTTFSSSTNPAPVSYRDADGNLTTFDDDGGTLVVAVYKDISGNRTRFDGHFPSAIQSYTDTAGDVTEFDENGVTKFVEPGVGTTDFDSGNVKKFTAADNSTVEYDDLGNIVKVTDTNGTELTSGARYQTIVDNAVTATQTARSKSSYAKNAADDAKVAADAAYQAAAFSAKPAALVAKDNAVAARDAAVDAQTSAKSYSEAITQMATDGVNFSQSDFNKFVDALNVSLTSALRTAALTAEKYDYAGYSIATQEDAQIALDALNKAITEKDKIRAHLGAVQNRLENTISNLNIQAENLQAAESRISDVDVATEMTEFVRQQILSQSAVAMLAQANSLPKMAMQLIGG